MKKWTAWCITVVALVSIIAGCATVNVYSSDPKVQKVSNQYFDAEFEPLLADGHNYFNRFRFVFTNRTDTDLTLEWQNTFYLTNGRKNGRFVGEEILTQEGMNWEKLKEIRSHPDINVPAKSIHTIILYPKYLIGREFTRRASSKSMYSAGVLPEGENGIEFVVKLNGKKIRKKIITKIELR